MIDASHAEAFEAVVQSMTREPRDAFLKDSSNWGTAGHGLILRRRGRIGKSALGAGWRSWVEEDERSWSNQLMAVQKSRPVGSARCTNGGWTKGAGRWSAGRVGIVGLPTHGLGCFWRG